MKKDVSLIRYFRSFLLLVVFLAGSLPIPAQAMEFNEPFFSSNDILYLGEGGVCSSATSAGSQLGGIPELVGDDNAEKIWNFLIAEGLSEEQAAGLMGNIYQEAGFDPDLEEGNGIGYGIVQWSFERRTALEAAAAEQGVAVSDLGFQLAYMVEEAKTPPLVDFNGLFAKYNATSQDNVWDLLKEQDTIEDATIVFHDGFERSNDYKTHGGIQHRIDYANEVFEKFTGRSAGGLNRVAAAGNCVNNNFVSGNLIETLLAYAWPEYHEPPYIEMMPAYAEAVKRAQSEGRGVGGIAHPGIDCAGFVSLLLVDSGFDPEYNTRGTYATPGSTGEAIQRSWMEEHWESIGTGGSINAADLKPGDVAVTRPGSGEHIFLHVGEVEGFENIFASASLDERAPMAGGTYENATSPAYDWFRKK